MTVEQLHIQHGAYLLTCLRLYGVPESECEDVRQNLYLKLLESKTPIEEKIAKGYCATIARNAAIDYKRKTVSAPPFVSVSSDEDNATRPEIDSLAFTDWQRVVSDYDTERIVRALELSQTFVSQGHVPICHILNSLLEGFTLAEIGKEYGVDKATISRWLKDWHLWISEVLPKREVEKRLK